MKDRTALGARYGKSITISEDNYKQIKRDEANGKPGYPVGTRFERVEANPVVYRVHWPEADIERSQRAQGESEAQSKIDSYTAHVNIEAIEAAEKFWKNQEKGWQDAQDLRDRDYVTWLESSPLSAALQYDFADRVLLTNSVKEKKEFRANLGNAMARVEAVSRCYGGGICGLASLTHTINLYKKDESDPAHHVAAAIIKPFDLLALIALDPGARASLYDALVGTRTAAVEQLRTGWTTFATRDLSHLASLIQMSTAATNEMRHLALSPERAKKAGVTSQMAMARSKQGI